MESRVRVLTTELIGTFCLVVLASGVVCAAHLPEQNGGPRFSLMWEIALADGCALAVLLCLSTSISEGCLNPALTLMLWVCKRLDGWQTALLILMQLTGSLLAGMALRVVFPEQALILARLGTPHLGSILMADGDAVTWTSLFTGIGVEAFMTFVLTLIVFYAVLDHRMGYFSGLLPGLAQVVITLAAFNLTGGAANPARWFGPALWQLSIEPLKNAAPFADHTVYWAGPIVGSLLGGLLYTTIISPPRKSSEAGS
jgi:glycerol uptake facilitator-like aquaporin